MDVADAAGDDLAAWNDETVASPGGHVLQSLEWGRHRERGGWKPHFLRVAGAPVLALTRPWPVIGGGTAYLSRGPSGGGVEADTRANGRDFAAEVAAVARWLSQRGSDLITADPEIPASNPFRDGLRRVGFRETEELQPSRHRMDVDLGGADEGELFKSFSSTTRNLVRQAERQDLVVRRLDRELDHPASDVAPARQEDFDAPRPVLERLFTILEETSRRRGFALAAWPSFESWTKAGISAGFTFALVVERPDGDPICGATFYRHGRRLTYALSGERADIRRDHPGAVRLLLWRAMQIAVREGRAIMDLGGVDVPGARRMPREGEPEYGMLQFKQSFGARWVELAGAHELVVRPRRVFAGRVARRVLR